LNWSFRLFTDRKSIFILQVQTLDFYRNFGLKFILLLNITFMFSDFKPIQTYINKKRAFSFFLLHTSSLRNTIVITSFFILIFYLTFPNFFFSNLFNFWEYSVYEIFTKTLFELISFLIIITMYEGNEEILFLKKRKFIVFSKLLFFYSN